VYIGTVATQFHVVQFFFAVAMLHIPQCRLICSKLQREKPADRTKFLIIQERIAARHEQSGGGHQVVLGSRRNRNFS
jgi:hypothetical protein